MAPQSMENEKPQGRPWIRVGAGVHTGIAFVGAMGSSQGVSDIAVLGDVANVTARLASQAGVGEILVSEEAWRAAGLSQELSKTRQLQLKGGSQPMTVRVIQP